jgi:putative peptidoglycan lipid II flippase
LVWGLSGVAAALHNPAVDDKGHHEREKFFGAAKIVAALTLLSRVLAMVQNMGVTWLGANRTTDAFQIAFVIPNLFRRLFGEGALASAFVPVFTETAEHGGFDKARRLFANAFGILAVVLIGILVVLLLGLLAWRIFCPEFPGSTDRRLLIGLTTVMAPYMVFVCLLALGSAALNCRGHFWYPAFASVLLNLFMIVAVWVVAPLARTAVPGTLYIIAVSVIVAGIMQLGWALWLLRRIGFSIRPRLRPVEPGIGAMVKLLAPLLLGLGFLQLTSLFDYVVGLVLSATDTAPTIWLFGHEFARPLTGGVLVRLNAANRLYQFPMGVLAISLGTAVFPLLSRYAARGDLPNLRDSVNRAMRLSMMEGLATGVGMLLLAEPIIAMIYQHRAFRHADTAEAARMLQGYCLGMWAFCTYPVTMRAFYALKEPTKPLKVSCALGVFYMPMLLAMIWSPAISSAAFGIAAAVTFSLNVVIQSMMLRKRLGRLGGRKLAFSVARSLVACGVMAAVVVRLQSALGPAPSWLIVVTCVPTGAVVFLLVALLLRSPELRELWGRPGRAKQTSQPGYNGAEK